ncbi:protocadherin-18-like [Chiloscyllium plagiosum]|uniref:protocadherin-18-like n=1 Tax=Chiloscyllium plagiosum TaxID=36176 RepID=UPI001CB86371|nr:protocadherin-18-like [Chiloscyllium plagiosum]
MEGAENKAEQHRGEAELPGLGCRFLPRKIQGFLSHTETLSSGTAAMGQALLLFCCLVTTACPRDVSVAGVAYRHHQEDDGVRPLPPSREPADWRRREQESGAREDGGPAHCRLGRRALGDVGANGVRASRAGPEVILVPEGLAANSPIALVEAGSRLECQLEARGDFQLVRTYQDNYLMVSQASLDREKRAEYHLKLVTLRDGSAIPASPPILITVKVVDVNDNAPVFAESAYRVSIPENEAPNITILTVTASDRDQGANGRITYSIVDSSSSAGLPVSSLIGVHPELGTIYTRVSFDYERLRALEFLVEAQDGGEPPASSTVPVRLDIDDVNDNRPVFTSPGSLVITVPLEAAGECEPEGAPSGRPPSPWQRGGHVVTRVQAEDADSSANAEVRYELAAGGGAFSIDSSSGEIRACVLQPGDWAVTVRAWDRGSPPLSSEATFTLSFAAASDPTLAGQSLGPPTVTVLCLGALGAAALLLLPALLAVRARCAADKRDSRAYNCRRAETAYRLQPKRPPRQIQKAEITLLRPGGGRSRRGANAGPPSASPPPPLQPAPEERPGPGLEKAYPTLRRERDSQHRQLLRELVRLSMAGFSDCTLELTQVSPHVQQISQLLSLLHQGQFQAKPNFRGNKYLKNYRAAMQEADGTSLKDSGQGESEEGDSDCDTGRNSPIDRLLEEGLNDLLSRGGWTTPELGARASTGEELSLEELCWMLPSPLPLDYKENVFKPEPIENSPPICNGEKTTFSTFGKNSMELYAETEESAVKGSLLTEMSALFQLLLSQKAEAYAESSPELLLNFSGRRSIFSGSEGDGIGVPPGDRFPGCGRPGSGSRHLPVVQEATEQRDGTELDFHRLV